MNNCVIKGRLARDPELRRTQSDIPVASFTLAIDRRASAKGQERQTDFLDCVAWRGTAEFVCKYFAKGQEMLVRGSIQTRKWKDKEERNRVSVEIIADEVDFCGKKQDAPTRPANGYGESAVQASDFGSYPGEEDMPF